MSTPRLDRRASEHVAHLVELEIGVAEERDLALLGAVLGELDLRARALKSKRVPISLLALSTRVAHPPRGWVPRRCPKLGMVAAGRQ